MAGRQNQGNRTDSRKETGNEEENPNDPASLPERELPSCLQTAIEQYIVRKTGKDLTDPILLERLRRAIVAQKDDYWKQKDQRSLRYTKGYSVLGYLAYHFPVYFMQTRALMGVLAQDGLLKERMTILDAGTGPGVVPLAIADYYAQAGHGTANVYAIERSEEHVEAFLSLRDACVQKGGNVSIKPPVQADITTGVPEKVPGAVDLMVFSNVLNEVGGSVEVRADIIRCFSERLAPDGSILIIEPAEENTSTGLRVLSLALKKRDFTIHSPCTFVHGTNCTPDRCWSFTAQPRIRPTRLMGILAGGREPFRYINTDIKYSYVVLRKDRKTRSSCRISAGAPVLRLAHLRRHVDKRITVVASKMSENLGDAKTLVFKLCDGSCEAPVFAVLPFYHSTPENKTLVSASYGEVLHLTDVLVRHNRQHDAFNLLVSRHSVVSRLSD